VAVLFLIQIKNKENKCRYWPDGHGDGGLNWKEILEWQMKNVS
jgi:hypothetical protein